MTALFVEALMRSKLSTRNIAEAKGELGIWIILAVTGALSIFVSLTIYGQFAALLYATLPVTTGLFTHFHDWTGEKAAEPTAR